MSERSNKKRQSRKALWALAAAAGAVMAAGTLAQGAARVWSGGSSTDWGVAGNWGTAPANSFFTDTASFTTPFTGTNQPSLLTASYNIAGITTAGTSAITLSSGGSADILGIGATGITMSGSAGLTLSGPVVLGYSQTWTDGTAANLAINSTLSRTATINGVNEFVGSVLGLSATSTGGFTSSSLANDATGIIAPWLTIGTTTNTRYAMVSGGTISGYTGTTVTSIASLASATTNYESVTGGTQALAGAVTANTYRQGTLAAGATFNLGTNTFATNGFLNASGQTITVNGSGAGGFVVGSSGELVINGASGNIQVNAPITSSGNVTITGGTTLAGAVTLTGTGQLTLTGAGSLNGNLAINITGDLVLNGTKGLSEQGAATCVFANLYLNNTGGSWDFNYGGLGGAAGTNNNDASHSVVFTRSMNVGVHGNYQMGRNVNFGGFGPAWYTNGDATNYSTGVWSGAVTNGTIGSGNYGNFTFTGTTDNTGFSFSTGGGSTGAGTGAATFNVLSKTSSSTVHAIGTLLTVSSYSIVQLGGTGGDQIADTATVTMQDKGIFDFNGRSEAFTNLSGAGIIINSAAGTSSLLTTSNNASKSYSGGFGDGAGGGVLSLAVKAGTGFTQTFSGAAAYSGSTAIQSGTLKVSSGAGISGSVTVTPLGISGVTPTAFASGVTTITVTGASTLLKTGWAVSGAGLQGSTTISSIVGDTVTLNKATNAVSSGTYSFGNPNQATVASSTGMVDGMTIAGSGYGAATYIAGINGTTITLSHDNTATTAVSATTGTSGTIAAWQSLGSGVVTLGSATANATLDLSGSSQTVGGLALDAGVTSGNYINQVIGNTSTSANSVITIAGSSSSTYAGLISDKVGSTGSKTVALVMSSGTQALSGANTYSGGTTVSGGTLRVNNGAAIGTGSLTIGGGTLGNSSGGTITLTNNNTQTWSGDFAYSSANDLSLGTGAVALSGATRTVSINGAGNLRVGGAISGTGSGLTVGGSGTGMLILAGTNSYDGTTTVSSGAKLSVLGTIQYGNVVVQNGATIGGNGNINPSNSSTFNVQSGGHISPHMGTGSNTAILNVSPMSAQTTTMSGAVLDYNLGAPSVGDSVFVNAPLTLSGNFTLNLNALTGFNPGLSGATYKLLSSNYWLTNSGATFSIGTNTGNPNFIYSFNVTGSEVDLNVSLPPAVSRTWKGTGSGWDHTTTGNWVPSGAFSDYDPVTFDNTGASNQTVNVTESVIPSSITVNSDSSTANYTFNSISGGKITGFSGIEKRGSSTLTMAGLNDFTGAVNIHQGIVSVSNFNSLGDSSVGNTIGLGDSSTSGTLRYTGASGSGATNARAITVGSAGGTLDHGTADVTHSGVISGSGDLSILQGASNTTTLSNTANALTGNISVQQGTLSAASLGVGSGGKTLTLGTGGANADFTYTGAASFTDARSLAFNTSTITVSNSGVTAGFVSATGGSLTTAGSGGLTVNGATSLTGSLSTGGASQFTGNGTTGIGASLSTASTSRVTIAGQTTIGSGLTASDSSRVAITGQASIGTDLTASGASQVAINGQATIGGGITTSGTSQVTFSNTTATTTVTGAVSVGGGSSVTFNGPTSFAGASFSSPSGAALTLANNNNSSVSGTITIPAGATVSAGSSGAMGNSQALGSAVLHLTGGALRLKADGSSGGVSGFDGEEYLGGHWATNPSGRIDSNGVLNIVTPDLFDAGHGTYAWLNTQQSISRFVTSFTYTLSVVNPANGGGDGVAFVIQKSPSAQYAGTGATGGGNLGYGGSAADDIKPSAAILLDIYKNSRTALGINGSVANLPADTTSNTGAVDLRSQHPITVTLAYNGSTLTESLLDTVTGSAYSTSYALDLVSLLGSNTGYIGFTGGPPGWNGFATNQAISNFSFGAGIVNYGNAVNVTGGTSTIDSGSYAAQMGALTIDGGATLAVTGNAVLFPSTTFTGSGTYGFAPAAGATVALGNLGAAVASIQNTGAGILLLNDYAFNHGLGTGSTVATSTGTIGVIGNGFDTGLGGASVTLGDGGTLALASYDGTTNPVHFGSSLTLSGNATISAQPLVGGASTGVINLEGAGINIVASKTLTLTGTSGYTLNVVAPLVGDGTTTVAVAGGNIVIGTDNSTTFLGTARVTGGTLHLANAKALAGATAINVASGGTLDVQASAVNLGVASIAGGGTLQLSADQAGGVAPTATILGTLSVAASGHTGYNLNLGTGSTFQAANGGQNYAGSLTIAGTSTFGGTQNLTVGGGITNGISNGSLTVNSTGTLALNGATTLGGTVTVTQGTLSANNSLAAASTLVGGGANNATLNLAGALTGPLTVNTKGTVNANSGATITNALTINTGGTVYANSGSAISGAVTVNTGAVLNANGTNVMPGVAVSVPGGLMNVNADNPLGSTGSATITSLGTINMATAQSTSPTLVIGTAATPGGAFMGDATGVVWAYNPTGIATPVAGKVELYDGATLALTGGTAPDRVGLGLPGAVFYQGITNASGTYSAGDNGTTALYRGVSFGNWTPGASSGPVTFSGTLIDTSTTGAGGTNAGMDVQMNGIPVTLSGATFTTTDTIHGGIRFTGSGTMLTVNSYSGGLVSRVGAAADQNTAIVTLNSNSVASGNSFAISNGRATLGGADAVSAGGTLNVNSGGTVNLSLAPTTGTYRVNAGGVAFITNTTMLTGGATFNFAAGSLVVPSSAFNGATMATTATEFGNADIVMGNNMIFSGAGITLGQGARITTSVGNGDITMKTGGGGVNAASGATNVIMSAAGNLNLNINDNVNLTGVNLQIGDANNYSTVNLWYGNDMTRVSAAQTGSVNLGGTSVVAQDLLVTNGTAKITATTATFRDVTVNGGTLSTASTTGATVTAASLTITGGTGVTMTAPETLALTGTSGVSGRSGTIRISSAGTDGVRLQLEADLATSFDKIFNGTFAPGGITVGDGGLFYLRDNNNKITQTGILNINQAITFTGSPKSDPIWYHVQAGLRVDLNGNVTPYFHNLTLNQGAVFVVAANPQPLLNIRGDFTLAGNATGSYRNLNGSTDQARSFDIGNVVSSAPGTARTFTLGETTTQNAAAAVLTSNVYGSVSSDVTLSLTNATVSLMQGANLNNATVVLGPTGFTASTIRMRQLTANQNFGGNFIVNGNALIDMLQDGAAYTVGINSQVGSLTFRDATLTVNQAQNYTMQVSGNTTIAGTGSATLAGSAAVNLGTVIGSQTLTINQTGSTTAILGDSTTFTGTVAVAGGTTTISSVAGTGVFGGTARVTAGTLTVTPNLNGGTVTYGGGTLNLPAVSTLTNLNVTAGTYTTPNASTFNVANVSVGTGATLGVGAGTFNVSNNVAAAAGTVNMLTGATMRIASHGAGPVKVAQIGTLTATGAALTGKLDITDNALAIKSSNYAAVKALVSAGNLVSSTTDATGNRTLHYMAGSDALANGGSVFAGTGGPTISGTDVLVQYGWNGDLNMDGSVDYLDYAVIDNHYLNTPAVGPDAYAKGDLTGDGVINYLDYGMMDNAYLAQTAPHSAGAVVAANAALSSSAVPEPTALGLLGMGALGLLSRRRRTR